MWFKKLGSNEGFTICKHTDGKGDKKVYSLDLKYKDAKIPLQHISKVFSESDKRNLALSVFMSKAEGLACKDEIILVFDDPVVSFDDNRIELTCRQLKLLAVDFRQVIVTTHYRTLIEKSIGCAMPAKYVQIKDKDDSSYLAQFDEKEFSQSSHERTCDRIYEFIDGGANYEIFMNLRPFMEEHLKMRFQRQISQSGKKNMGLAQLIEELRDNKEISDNNAKELDVLRESLNPDHHATITDENAASARLEARDLMELLYGNLNK
jgi:wobble nucleotide-excising tRNase